MSRCCVSMCVLPYSIKGSESFLEGVLQGGPQRRVEKKQGLLIKIFKGDMPIWMKSINTIFTQDPFMGAMNAMCCNECKPLSQG